MATSVLSRSVLMPASAAAALSTTSLLLGEKGAASSTNRLVSSSLNKTASYLQNRTVWSSSGTRPGTQCMITSRPFSSTNRSLAGASKDTAKKAASTEQPENSMTFLQWYESHLQTRPVQTKMVTGAILWSLGDWVAQVVPSMVQKTDERSDPYDYARTGRAAIFGFAIHAPCSHVHFNLLEFMTNRLGLTGLQIPVFKAFMEQFVYWSWISNSLYHGAMGAMQGQTLSQIYDRIADVLWETQKAQWVFWIPIQLLNFRFVPVRHQLNVVLLTSIVWTALLSAWYPPEKEEKKEIVKEARSEN